MADPFAQYRADERPSDEAFAKLNDLIRDLVLAEDKVAQAEEALKLAQERRRQLEEFDIPNYLEELGLASFTTTEGLEITVERKLRASIGSRKAQAYKWLLENGHGAIIKRTVEAAFNTEQSHEAQSLLAELQGRGLAGVRQELKVEPATLTAWVREQLEQGVDIPAELFGIYEQKRTRIKRPE